MTDLMIDIETLGVEEDCKIISVATVEFNDQITWNPRVWKFDWINGQKDRFIEPQTVLFWFTTLVHNPKLLETIKPDKTEPASVKEFIERFSSLVSIVDRIWARSPMFDGTIITHFVKQHASNLPLLTYRKWRDVRTVEDYLTPQEYDSISEQFTGVTHEPMADCMFQIKLVQSAWKKIGYPGDKADAAPEQNVKSVSTAG